MVNSVMFTLYGVLNKNETAFEMSSACNDGISAIAAGTFPFASTKPLAAGISVLTNPGDKLCNDKKIVSEMFFFTNRNQLTVTRIFLLSA